MYDYDWELDMYHLSSIFGKAFLENGWISQKSILQWEIEQSIYIILGIYNITFNFPLGLFLFLTFWFG